MTKLIIVQMHLDEVYTNRMTVYRRVEDRLVGCGYSNCSATKTEEHQTALVFAVRSLLTCFNVILNGYPYTRHKATMAEKVEENVQLTEETGLDVKGVVCDRNPSNKDVSSNFINAVYNRRRADGSTHHIHLIYDCPYILEGFVSKLKRATSHQATYDQSIFLKLGKMRTSSSGFWARRGCALSYSVPWAIAGTMQYNNIQSATLQVAINANDIANDGGRALRTCDITAMLTQFANVFHRSSIDSTTWNELQVELKEVHDYMEQHLIADPISVNTRPTINNFVHLMDEPVQAYPGVTIIALYKVSQDLLEGFFHNIAHGNEKKSRAHQWKIRH